ncbi:MAG: Nif3-like dinuclear metal center hexameric protein [Desulfobulbaceae bacterium]|jgi:dinuclear metal center YbgI/SA1388 family protein|nr:Nif3-like dinuclear metal center hexameric protein [Desulfobulbaceae bacterium]
MSIRIRHLLEHLDTLAPPELAEPWDNVGLLLGDDTQRATRVLVCLDVSPLILDEAILNSCQVIVSHHPPIFKPLARIDTRDPLGGIVKTALRHDIAFIACHTNLDSAQGGVSDALARALGLEHCRPLQTKTGFADAGLGRIGRFDHAVPGDKLLRRVAAATANRALAVAGKMPTTVTTVALCGGSGSEFAPLARDLGADVYLSGEIKHSMARWACDAGFCLIDGGHYGTERLAVDILTDHLRGAGIDARRATNEQSPFNLVDC